MSLGLNTLHFNSILFCAPPPRPTSALNFPQTRSCWCLLKLSVLPFYFRYKFNKTHNGSFQIHQIWSASAVNVEPSPTVRAVLMLYPWTRVVPLLGHNQTHTNIETNISAFTICSSKHGNFILRRDHSHPP